MSAFRYVEQGQCWADRRRLPASSHSVCVGGTCALVIATSLGRHVVCVHDSVLQPDARHKVPDLLLVSAHACAHAQTGQLADGPVRATGRQGRQCAICTGHEAEGQQLSSATDLPATAFDGLLATIPAFVERLYVDFGPTTPLPVRRVHRPHGSDVAVHPGWCTRTLPRRWEASS